VLGVDRAIGELIAELERLGLSEETVIVLTANHGEEFFDHGLLRHGYQLYNETVTVPLIVHLPKREQTRGTQVEAPVALLDVFPTLVTLAELDAAHGDGHLLPGTGTAAPAEDDSRTIWGMTRFRNQDEAFIVGFGHKLIRDARERSYLLYDLENDPEEARPLAVEESRACQLLRGQLDAIVANLDKAAANAPDRGAS
jgi:arylsulfatase A-like enzyme